MYQKLSYEIIGCCFRVHSALGPGLLEQCYHNALYFADLVVEGKFILELKSVKRLTDTHRAQLQWQRIVV